MGNSKYALIQVKQLIEQLNDQFTQFQLSRRNFHISPKQKYFQIVDVSEAFHNVVLDEPSSLLTTFQGSNGRYRYLRMPYGILSGPEEYQRRQQEFLEGLEGVINIADDICVYGCGDTEEEANEDHDKNLITLLNRCRECDLRLSAKKIQFKSASVSFMGHILTFLFIQIINH